MQSATTDSTGSTGFTVAREIETVGATDSRCDPIDLAVRQSRQRFHEHVLARHHVLRQQRFEPFAEFAASLF